jgi:hypothetical protein
MRASLRRISLLPFTLPHDKPIIFFFLAILSPHFYGFLAINIISGHIFLRNDGYLEVRVIFAPRVDNMLVLIVDIPEEGLEPALTHVVFVELHPDLPAVVKYPAEGPYLLVNEEDLSGLQLLAARSGP